MRYYDEQSGLYYEIKEADGHSYAMITDADKRMGSITVPPALNDKPVEVVGKKAFLGCKGLRELTLPGGIREIGEWAFAFCDNLRRINIRRGSVALAKGAFKNDSALRDIFVCDGECPCENDERAVKTSRLLAAAPVYMDADYLIDIKHAGSDEWLNKWDTKLKHILSLKDDEGYHLYVLCGEEDLHFDYDQYLEYNRDKKAYLCMLRLVNDSALKDEVRKELEDYVIAHTIDCESDASIRVLLKQFSEDKDYYDLMLNVGAITKSNLERVLDRMGDRHSQMKAYLIEKCGMKGGSGFLDELMI